MVLNDVGWYWMVEWLNGAGWYWMVGWLPGDVLFNNVDFRFHFVPSLDIFNK